MPKEADSARMMVVSVVECSQRRAVAVSISVVVCSPVDRLVVLADIKIELEIGKRQSPKSRLTADG